MLRTIINENVQKEITSKIYNGQLAYTLFEYRISYSQDSQVSQVINVHLTLVSLLPNFVAYKGTRLGLGTEWIWSDSFQVGFCLSEYTVLEPLQASSGS